MKQFLQNQILKIALAQSILAMSGSLYFSEVLKLEPCTLCWYQRIAIYSLSVILLIGLLRKDKNVIWYAWPFSVAGLVVAIYHNIIYYLTGLGLSLICTSEVSCTTKLFEVFGFISIPLLSLAAFFTINICLFIYTIVNFRKGKLEL